MIECNNCKLKYCNLNKNNLCEFCDIIINLNKNNLYKFIICYSKLEQIDIIKKTYEYFINNDKFPLVESIDKDAVIISINPYFFKKYIKDKNYKIFFTNMINKNNIKIKKLGLPYPLEKLNISNYTGIDLKKFDEKIYNEYTNILNI
jgi:hypothetical protein